MVTKGQMNVVIGLLILSIACIGVYGLANSGMLVKEKKYVNPDDKSNYIIFYSEDKTALVLKEGEAYQAKYVETDAAYSIFVTMGNTEVSKGIVLEKIDSGHIKGTNSTTVFVLEKGTFFNNLGF